MEFGCTHYVRLDMAENRICACNRCGEPMILDKKALMLAKPHCLNCTRVKDEAKKETLDVIDSFLNNRI